MARLPDVSRFRLPDADANGVAMQVLSLTVPGIQADPGLQRAVDNARYVNDSLAAIIGAHPTRFAAFAALPLQAPARGRDRGAPRCRTARVQGRPRQRPHPGKYLDDPASIRYGQPWPNSTCPCICTGDTVGRPGTYSTATLS
jgi:2,3-dihydroxybenzoate decarboxylase